MLMNSQDNKGKEVKMRRKSGEMENYLKLILYEVTRLEGKVNAEEIYTLKELLANLLIEEEGEEFFHEQDYFLSEIPRPKLLH